MSNHSLLLGKDKNGSGMHKPLQSENGAGTTRKIPQHLGSTLSSRAAHHQRNVKSMVYSRLTTATIKPQSNLTTEEAAFATHNNGLTERRMCPFLGANTICFSLFCCTHNTLSDIHSTITRHIKKSRKSMTKVFVFIKFLIRGEAF